MSASIIQDTRECYIRRAFANLENYCGPLSDEGLERHHIMFGYSSKDRIYSEHFGLWVYLCPEHHRTGDVAPHQSKGTDNTLRRIAQTAFERKYSHEYWMQIFRKNYLED